MAASIVAKTDGAVAQYGLSATAGLASTAITPYDSGTILGTVPPGKAGIKLVSGVIQNATTPMTVTPAGTDPQNFLSSTAQPQRSGDPTVNAAQVVSAGLSLGPQTE